MKYRVLERVKGQTYYLCEEVDTKDKGPGRLHLVSFTPPGTRNEGGEEVKLRDTKMLLEDAVRMQAPRAVWGGVARRQSQFERLAWRFNKALKPVLAWFVGDEE